MQIISHRGFWKDSAEKNKINAFERSFNLGFGTETDIRDLNLKIVVSHDMPSDINLNIDLSQLIDIFLKKDLTLALNIKSDGLHSKLLEILKEKKCNNYFVFDMSIPDTIEYIKLGMNVFCRQSEFEQNVPCLSRKWCILRHFDTYIQQRLRYDPNFSSLAPFHPR